VVVAVWCLSIYFPVLCAGVISIIALLSIGFWCDFVFLTISSLHIGHDPSRHLNIIRARVVKLASWGSIYRFLKKPLITSLSCEVVFNLLAWCIMMIFSASTVAKLFRELLVLISEFCFGLT